MKTISKFMGCSRSSVLREVHSIKYIRKEESSQINDPLNDLNFHLKKSEKNSKLNPQKAEGRN